MSSHASEHWFLQSLFSAWHLTVNYACQFRLANQHVLFSLSFDQTETQTLWKPCYIVKIVCSEQYSGESCKGIIKRLCLLDVRYFSFPFSLSFFAFELHMVLKNTIKKWAYLLSSEMNSLRDDPNSLSFQEGSYKILSQCFWLWAFQDRPCKAKHYADLLSYK